MRQSTFAQRTAAVVGALTAAMLMAACSSGSAGGTSTSGSPGAGAALNPMVGIAAPKKDSSLAAMVPKDLLAKPYITVGMDPSNPPKEFVAPDGTTIQGVDVDLVYGVGDILGLKMKIQSGAFATLIPGAQNGRYDLLNSSMSPTLARQQVLDFVQTDLSGEQLLVQKANAGKYNSLEALCGATAGAVTGGNELVDLTAQSQKCSKPIQISAFPDSNSLNLALTSGRIDAGFFDSPVSAYQAQKSQGKLVNIGPIYRAGDEAMAMAKGTGFAQAVAAAENKLIKSGVYAQIFKKWGLSKASMLPKVLVNPPQPFTLSKG
jgi:polar amino acid transport system substrate-binding protein